MSRRTKLPAPTLIDRIVGHFSPRAGFERLSYRMATAAVSGYAAGRRDRAATRSWSAVSASADAETLPDLETLRSRSYDMVRNDPLAQSAISTKAVNVIGAGHMVRPELDEDRLGMSRAEADAWEDRALEIWTDWAASPDCDLVRAQDFAGLEDLVYRSALMGGDVFVLRRHKTRPGRLLGSCCQVIEAGRCSNPRFAADSEEIAGGVEYDADGAPRAYHFANRYDFDRHRAGSVTWQRVPAFGANGRRLVLHIHGTRWRPDMSRYAPMLAPVLESLKQRSRYSEAELTAAVVSACFAVVTKSEDGDLMKGMPNLAAGQAGANDRNPIKVSESGTVVDLAVNEEIQAFEPGRPNAQFAPFIEAVAQEVGAGTDLPYELLMKKFQASYSASRAALEMAWQFFRVDRTRHVRQFCQPTYAEVIGEAVARGLLEAPGFFGDPLRRKAWLGATWMGPARITIDPVKDAKSDKEYLDMGATSLTRITAERFGQDVRDVRRRRAADGSAPEQENNDAQ